MPRSLTYAHCHQQFATGRKGQRFCGPDCFHASRKDRVQRICQQCGISFEVIKKERDQRRDAFMSQRGIVTIRLSEDDIVNGLTEAILIRHLPPMPTSQEYYLQSRLFD